MTKEKSHMQQKTFDFDAPAARESSQVAESTSLPPPMIRPDRQDTFGGRPHYEWPAPEHDRDSITVDRIYATEADGTSHRFTVTRGDTVEVYFSKHKREVGTVSGISHSKNEVGVTFTEGSKTIWFAKGAVYPAPEPSPTPHTNGIQLSELITKHNHEPDDGFSAAELVHPPYSFDDYKEFRKQMAEGTLSIEEYHSQFARLLASKKSMIEELQSRFKAPQLKALASRFGDWNASRNTKPENAKSIHRKMMLSFVLDGVVSYGMGSDIESAIRKKVDAVTEADLASALAEARTANAEHEKALANPETLEEYRTFTRYKSADELTDSQLSKWDNLEADETRIKRQSNKNTTVEKFEADEVAGVEFTIKEGYHDKKQIPLWIVQLGSRVERSTFMELKTKAHMLGGWYSSFKKADAGFQFKSLEDAESFSSLLSEDADRADVLERHKERKQMTAAERLEDLADELYKRAEETIAKSKESLQNTARRADIQAGVRGRAYAEQALAHTLVSISDGLASGEAKYLDGIRHKSHVELLQSLLYRAKWAHLRAMKRGDAESSYAYDRRMDDEDNRAPHLADVRYAEYPYPSLYKRHLQEAIAKCSDSKGAKMASAKMAKRIAKAPEYVDFTESYDIERLEDFLGRAKAAGYDTTWLKKSVDDYHRLQRANIHTIHELRAALRELLPHIGQTRGDDAVELAERELIGKKLVGFFPTPKSIIRQMIEEAGIEDHHRVLEPSAGKGDILDSLRDAHPNAVRHAIELNRSLQDVLDAKGHEVQFADFMQHQGRYDRVLMNPPFEKGQDIDHVQHAYSLLEPGGRVVAIMGEGAFFRSDKKAVQFQRWAGSLEATSVKLPEDAFKGVDAFRHTGVRTRLVVIDKPRTLFE